MGLGWVVGLGGGMAYIHLNNKGGFIPYRRRSICSWWASSLFQASALDFICRMRASSLACKRFLRSSMITAGVMDSSYGCSCLGFVFGVASLAAVIVIGSGSHRQGNQTVNEKRGAKGHTTQTERMVGLTKMAWLGCALKYTCEWTDGRKSGCVNQSNRTLSTLFIIHPVQSNQPLPAFLTVPQ